MKKRLMTLLGVALLLTICSCSKGKFCKCTLDNDDKEVRVVNVDHFTSCKKLTQIGVETQYTPEGDTVATLRREMVDMTCEKIKGKEYPRRDE